MNQVTQFYLILLSQGRTQAKKSQFELVHRLSCVGTHIVKWAIPVLMRTFLFIIWSKEQNLCWVSKQWKAWEDLPANVL